MLLFVLPPCLICNGKHHPTSTSPTLHHAGWVYKGGQWYRNRLDKREALYIVVFFFFFCHCCGAFVNFSCSVLNMGGYFDKWTQGAQFSLPEGACKSLAGLRHRLGSKWGQTALRQEQTPRGWKRKRPDSSNVSRAEMRECTNTVGM